MPVGFKRRVAVAERSRELDRYFY